MNQTYIIAFVSAVYGLYCMYLCFFEWNYLKQRRIFRGKWGRPFYFILCCFWIFSSFYIVFR